jgi:hypothetical protein
MRHAVDRPSGLDRSRIASQATFQGYAGAPRNPQGDAGPPRAVRKRGRRPGPPPWSGPPSVARALATLYTTVARDRFNKGRHSRVSATSAGRLILSPWGGNYRLVDRSRGCRRRSNAGHSARNCAVWTTIRTGKRLKRTFRHAPNTSDHQSYGQSVECVTDRGLCRCWRQRGWLLRGTVPRLEPNVVGEEPQGGDEPCVVVCVVSRSPRSR